MHLVGRSEQREAIRARAGWERRRRGRRPRRRPGSGRTALLTWAAAAAAERGLQIDVLDDADGSDETVARLRALDADPAQHRLVLAASAIPLGLRTELPLPPLTVDEIAAFAEGLPPDVARAVRAASRGLPGPALALLAAGVPDADDPDPVIALALAVSGDVPFLEIDDAVVASWRPPSPETRRLRTVRCCSRGWPASSWATRRPGHAARGCCARRPSSQTGWTIPASGRRWWRRGCTGSGARTPPTDRPNVGGVVVRCA